MKKIISIAFFLFCLSAFAQAPQGINYQGIARDNAGNAMSKTNIGVEFKLWQGNPGGGGSLVFSEVHNSVLTDTFGLYSLVIGSASGSGTGTFNAVPWSAGNIWVEVYIDPANSGTFNSPIASQQLMSVPYALYAQTSGSGGSGSVTGTANNIPRINNAGNGLGRSLLSQSADSLSIGINNPSPLADAVLDIVNTGTAGGAGKGLLIPRMTFAERSAIPVSALHHGLLVFQTNSQNTFTPEGFWYYDAVNSAWLLLAPAQATWTLSGNFTGVGNFLGTLNGTDLIIKTNNTERMRVLGTNGNVQFGNSGSSTQYIFPPAIGNAGDILQLDPGGTNNLIWKPFGSSGSFWQRSGGKLYPATLSDTVGIGTSSPQASLDVFTNNGLALLVTGNDTLNPVAKIISSNSKSGYPALDVDASATLGNAINATASNAYALSGVSQDASALWVQNNSGGAATIDAYNSGTHSVAYLHNAAINGTAPVLFATTSDPSGYSAQFTGGLGITTDGITISGGGPQNGYFLMANSTNGDAKWSPINGLLPPPANGHILYDSLGTWKPSLPTSLFFDGKKMGIGNPAPNTLLDIISNGTSGGVNVVHNGANGHGLAVIIPPGSANGNAIHASNASTSSSGVALFATNTGGGGAGFFSINSSTNNSPALYATTNGSGPAIEAFIGTGATAPGVSIFANGSGHSLLSNSSGGGDAVNANVSGNTGIAGNFQISNATNSAPALQAMSSGTGPALKAIGGSGPAALFSGGGVGIGAVANPTSGLDVKTSIAVSVKKWTTTSNAIGLNDQNLVHMAGASGNTTFSLPDATQCVGRLLIFTVDGSTNTGGQIILTTCCGQNLNGSGSQSFSLVISGVNKTSIGVVSDGANWNIIFKI